jgi:hypothetical protein
MTRSLPTPARGGHTFTSRTGKKGCLGSWPGRKEESLAPGNNQGIVIASVQDPVF